MVNASQGVLLERYARAFTASAQRLTLLRCALSDVPLTQFVISLDDQLPQRQGVQSALHVAFTAELCRPGPASQREVHRPHSGRHAPAGVPAQGRGDPGASVGAFGGARLTHELNLRPK
jgi:hypothetical protein